MIRNLLVHVFPQRDGQKWRRTAAHLLQRRELFNGRRILTVSLDDTTDSLATVKEAFAGLDAEYLEFRNNPLQESVTFLHGMDLLASTAPDEMTFRCHSKGCTHASDAATSHVWADVMFTACLDFPELVDCILKDVAIAGCFRWLGLWPFPKMYSWHYSGSFFWFRHDRTFNREWRFLMPTLWAVEAWPGIFPVAESGCFFHDGDGSATTHLYSHDHWKQMLAPEFQIWRKRMESVTGRTAWLPADTLLRAMLA